MNNPSSKEEQTNYYFNSSEEHLSTLTIHYFAYNELKKIHLIDIIWFECIKTKEVSENGLIIEEYNDSVFKKNYEALIVLCQLVYDDVKHVIIRHERNIINALVTSISISKNGNSEYSYLHQISQKHREKLIIEPGKDLLPDYKNFGRTEVTFIYYVDKNILALTGHFHHTKSFEGKKITLFFEQVHKITHNPINTIDKKYGDSVIYSNGDVSKLFTCFSALRDPIEIVAENVDLIREY